MLVVADASPLIVLCNIGQIDLLPSLFRQILVPPQIIDELKSPNRTQATHDFIDSAPSWLIVRSPARIEPVPALDAGEQAAISLAIELSADLLLIDEAKGRKIALDQNIRITGTIGILELAAERGFIDLRNAFENIKATDFWISHELLDERLRLHARRRKK